MSVAKYDDDVRLAHVLVDAVERRALEFFGSPDLQVSVSSDGSLVTDAATQVEELLRHQLHRTRPRDRVEGRMLETTGGSERRWVIDAIDGTANYVRGVPVWATLISLVVEGEPVFGLVAAPSLARRWWAGQGSGAWTGRDLTRARPVQVSNTAVLAHASMSVDEVASWMFGPQADGFTRLNDQVWRTRGFGDFWSHALVAEGAADVALAARLDGYQFAALSALLREAGAEVSDPQGTPLSLAEVWEGAPVVATNGALHPAVLHALAAEDGALG